MAGVGALKSFLPKGTPSPVGEITFAEDSSASWHEADLGGGRSCVMRRVAMLTAEGS